MTYTVTKKIEFEHELLMHDADVEVTVQETVFGLDTDGNRGERRVSIQDVNIYEVLEYKKTVLPNGIFAVQQLLQQCPQSLQY